MLQVSGTINELLQDRAITIRVKAPAEAALEELAGQGLTVEDRGKETVLLKVGKGMSAYDGLRICEAKKLGLIAVAPRRETLEELFVRVVGEAAAERRAVQ